MENGRLDNRELHILEAFKQGRLEFSGDNGNPLGAGQGAVACLEKGAS